MYNSRVEHTDRRTNRQRAKWTDRRKIDRQKDSQKDSQKERHTERWTEVLMTNRHIDIRT